MSASRRAPPSGRAARRISRLCFLRDTAMLEEAMGRLADVLPKLAR